MQGATRREWHALYKGRNAAMSNQTHSRRASAIEKTIALICGRSPDYSWPDRREMAAGLAAAVFRDRAKPRRCTAWGRRSRSSH